MCRYLTCFMALLLLVGCGESEDGRQAFSALMPAELRPAESDPLNSHRPESVDCPAAAWGEEFGSFEVQTGVCNYGAFVQPLPQPIQAGDLVEITVWHDFLDAAEPATGHVAVWLGDQVIWEEEVAIPAQSSTLSASVAIDFEPAADAKLGLHLHNHGFNSWRFVSVDVEP